MAWERRVVHRRAAGWAGRCRFEESSEAVDCWVIEVSGLGAAIEVPAFSVPSTPVQLSPAEPHEELKPIYWTCEMMNA